MQGIDHFQLEEYNRLMQVVRADFSEHVGYDPEWEPIATFSYQPYYRKLRVTNKTDSQAFTVTFIPVQTVKVNSRGVVSSIRDEQIRQKGSKIHALLNTVIAASDTSPQFNFFAILQKFYAQPLVKVFHRGSDPTASGNLLALPPGPKAGSQAHPSSAAIQKSTVTTQAVIDYLIGAVLITDQITQNGLILRLQDVDLANFLVVKSAYSNSSGITKSRLEASRLLMNFEELEPYMNLPNARDQAESWQLLKKLAELFLPYFHKALHGLAQEQPFEKINFKHTLAFMSMSNAGVYTPLIKMLVDIPNSRISLQEFAQRLKEAPEFVELRTKHGETFKQYDNLASDLHAVQPAQILPAQNLQAHPPNSKSVMSGVAVRNLQVPLESVNSKPPTIMGSVMGVKQIADITNGLDSDDIHYGLAQIRIDFMRNYIKFLTTSHSDLRFLLERFQMPQEEGHRMLVHYNWALQATLEALGLRIQIAVEDTHRHVMKQEGLHLYEMIEAQKSSLALPFAAWRTVINQHYQEWNSAFKKSRTNLGEMMKISETMYTNPSSSSVEEILGHLKNIFFTFYMLAIEFLEGPAYHSTFIGFQNPELSRSGQDARSSYTKALWRCLFQLHFTICSWAYFPPELGPTVDFDQLKAYIRNSDNAQQVKQEMNDIVKAPKSMLSA